MVRLREDLQRASDFDVIATTMLKLQPHANIPFFFSTAFHVMRTLSRRKSCRGSLRDMIISESKLDEILDPRLLSIVYGDCDVGGSDIGDEVDLGCYKCIAIVKNFNGSQYGGSSATRNWQKASKRIRLPITDDYKRVDKHTLRLRCAAAKQLLIHHYKLIPKHFWKCADGSCTKPPVNGPPQYVRLEWRPPIYSQRFPVLEAATLSMEDKLRGCYHGPFIRYREEPVKVMFGLVSPASGYDHLPLEQRSGLVTWCSDHYVPRVQTVGFHDHGKRHGLWLEVLEWNTPGRSQYPYGTIENPRERYHGELRFSEYNQDQCVWSKTIPYRRPDTIAGGWFRWDYSHPDEYAAAKQLLVSGDAVYIVNGVVSKSKHGKGHNLWSGLMQAAQAHGLRTR